VAAAREIEDALEAAGASTPGRVQDWLETNLAEQAAAPAVHTRFSIGTPVSAGQAAAASTPGGGTASTPGSGGVRALPQDSPLTMLVKARGGAGAGGAARGYGGQGRAVSDTRKHPIPSKHP
jgi:hypothetical protein